MTTAARRRAEHLSRMARCPTQRAVGMLSERWVPLLLRALSDGPRRHGELARDIAGVTQKMLTQTLRRLERHGLVAREVGGGVPARVDYRLTPRGESLLPVLAAITAWAEANDV